MKKSNFFFSYDISSWMNRSLLNRDVLNSTRKQLKANHRIKREKDLNENDKCE